MVRKGQSRLWLDDNGWWMAIAEFQPSQWSKGTYLNVAVSWQWYPRVDYAFDLANHKGHLYSSPVTTRVFELEHAFQKNHF